MTRDEFSAAWERLHAKLTADERELLDVVVAGAEANHTLLYMGIALLVGFGVGWSLAQLWG